MSETTQISYADHTWSPWRGCEYVSPGCANCYAATLAKRCGLDCYGKGKPRIKTKDWKKPRRWNKQAALSMCGDCDPCVAGHPGQCAVGGYHPRVFVSLCDPFDDAVPIEWLADFLQLIYDTPNLTWLLLTKRPENWKPRWRELMIGTVTTRAMARHWLEWNGPPNVWLGVTCENQELADKRIPLLMDIPAKVRWISFEPLLGPIMPPTLRDGTWWSVIGGESGAKHRPCDPRWITCLADHFKADQVPIWIKQDSARFPGQQGRIPDEYWDLEQLPKL